MSNCGYEIPSTTRRTTHFSYLNHAIKILKELRKVCESREDNKKLSVGVAHRHGQQCLVNDE